MEKLGLNAIREKYLEFFESKAHLRLSSFSLVPQNDKSLLIINAGMAPLKPYFTGQKVPPNKRITTCQKCVRTGDIENVGKTARHGTFFEMLGNFSFGDYFKEEIIPWAWEFITEVLEIPKDKLWITVYQDDEEAKNIWIEKVGVPAERIVKMGKEDNFWEHGSGPCGPCSEIYFDRGKEFGCDSPSCGVGCDCDRYIEFWNLVFTQFDRQDDGTYEKLAFPNIDTGMGLERMATIMQGVQSIFDVDTIQNIVNTVATKANIQYGKGDKTDVSVRVITDHVRSIAHMISDGILPSNGGRGYVLKRLLRRASRHCKLIGINELYLSTLVDVVVDNSKDAYPILEEKRAYIKRVILKEEEGFNQTLDQGLSILNDYIAELKNNGVKVLSGDKAFKLYDTFGFPIDLTGEILEEKGLSIDNEGFEAAMEIQRETARIARKETNYMGQDLDIFSTIDPSVATEFHGYDSFEQEGKVLVIVKDDEVVQSVEEGDNVSIILDKTALYVEMGGQLSDTGIIENDAVRIEVVDCKRTPNGKEVHIGKVVSGSIETGDIVKSIVTTTRRLDIARNHTATHMLQAALRKVLGDHVEQKGSLVTPERLRFDFTNFEALSKDEIKTVEDIVNEKILQSIAVNTVETSIDKAKEMGAMALFGEKYGDNVRVVSVGDYSIELCGGTHVSNTGTIGMFKIISEGSAAAGVRRIEAITGKACFEYLRVNERKINEIASKLKTSSDEVENRVDGLLQEVKNAHKEIESLKAKIANSKLGDILTSAKDVNGVKFAYASLEGMDADSLRALGDGLKEKIGCGIILLVSDVSGKVLLLSMATKDAVGKGAHCGNLIREVAKIVGGGGGGRPDMAQAGGKDASKINEGLEKAVEVVNSMIK